MIQHLETTDKTRITRKVYLMNHSKYTSKYTVHQCLPALIQYASKPINGKYRNEYYHGFNDGRSKDPFTFTDRPMKSGAYIEGYKPGFKIYKLNLALRGLHNG